MRITLALLLCACASTQRPMPSREVVAVVDAWRGAGLPFGDNCRDEASDVTVRAVNAAEYLATCGGPMCPQPSGPCGDSCFTYDSSFMSAPDPVVVVGEAFDLPGHRAHEMLHWLQECNRMAPDHADPMLWGRPDGLLARLGG